MDSNSQSTIDKIKALANLLSTSTPCDEQPQFGEGTKYQPVFNPLEREEIKKKIMSLVKQL